MEADADPRSVPRVASGEATVRWEVGGWAAQLNPSRQRGKPGFLRRRFRTPCRGP